MSPWYGDSQVIWRFLQLTYAERGERALLATEREHHRKMLVLQPPQGSSKEDYADGASPPRPDSDAIREYGGITCGQPAEEGSAWCRLCGCQSRLRAP